MNYEIAASIMCLNALDMRPGIEALRENGVEYLHCDIMDGHFVPNLMLSTELIKTLKRETDMRLDIHMMAERPENMLPWFAMGENDIVSIHYESTPHVQRALGVIRDQGAIPALALNPATPLACIEEVLPDIGMLLIMTVNPGFAAQKLVPQTLDKVRRARKMLDERGLAHVPIQVDGNCSFENIPKMAESGANIFVVGSSSIFNPALTIEEGVRKIRDSLKGL